MEIQLFDTELNMQAVDLQQALKEEANEKTKDKGKGVQEVTPEPEYTIIDVLDKPEKTETTEEKVEESKETQVKPTSEQSADSSKFPYSTFAKALYEEGVLSFFDEDEFKKLTEETGSEVEALIELNKQTIADQIDAYKNSLSAEGKDFLEALEKGVPLDRYIESKTKEYSYATIKEDSLADNDDLCKRLISDDLKLRGFDDDEIKDQIADMDNLGKLESKAKVSLKKLQVVHAEEIKKEKQIAEQRQKQAIEENKKQLAVLKAEIEKVNEVIPGVKINPKLKAELYDMITTPAEQTSSGQWINAVYAKRAKDPVSWDIKVAYLDKLGIFDGKWDKLLTSSKSAAVKDLTEKLNKGNISATGDPNIVEPTKTSKDILKSMEVFSKK